MSRDFWKKITFYCINEHPEPVEFAIQYGDSPFYACPRYFEMDNEHPDGHLYGQKACHNRLSFRDAEAIVSALAKRIESDMGDDCIADYTNYSFMCGHIRATVLDYRSDRIKIGIINRLAVAK